MRIIRNLFLPTIANNYRAQLLSNKALLLYVALLVVINMFFTGFGTARVYALIDAQEVVLLHNQERRKYGLTELRSNYTLQKSAEAKGKVMLAEDCWSHYCPEGVAPWKFFRDEGYVYTYAGENLAEGFTDTEAMMQAWMNSKTHRENVLKKEYTEIGVAIVIGDFQGIKNNAIVVVHFGKPKYESIDLSGDTEDSQINPDGPQIFEPKADSYIKDKTPLISGEYSDPVNLDINGKSHGNIIPDGGIFTYEPEEPLQEGKQKATVKDISDENKVNSVEFTVDTTAPTLKSDEIELYQTQSFETENTFSYGLDIKDDIEAISGRILDRNDEYQTLEVRRPNQEENNWTFDISIPPGTKISDNYAKIEFDITDKAGNQSQISLETKDLTTSKSDIEGISSENNAVGVFTKSFGLTIGRFGHMSFTQLLTIGIAMFLLGLYLLDHYYLRKHKLLNVASRYGHSHLHIPALILVLLVAMMGNLSGTI